MKSNPKVIAFYLPQFHRIPENDNWWGEGFTEWTAVRQASPLFPGHCQPRVPAYDNYYNLLDKNTMRWQADLARKAGIYGFCMYHYWFGDKVLLEKPAENLLGWKDININYCFSWANQSWIASWSKLKNGNAWIESNTRYDTDDSGLLLEQKYGTHEEWKRHFEYLLPFFKDKRYIKKDNKPIFIIYVPDAVPRLRDLEKYWKELAVSNGFNGIYFIGTNCDGWRNIGLDAAVRYEPVYTRCFEAGKAHSVMGKVREGIRERIAEYNIYFPVFYHYDRIWKLIIKRDFERRVYPGAFVDLDISPRKGKKAVIFLGASPRKFYKYFGQLYKKCYKKHCEYIFITAWNEWGEGAYLEPDKKYGVQYLKCIRKVLKNICMGSDTRETAERTERYENSSSSSNEIKQ